jgi:hypothetical protein
MECIAAVHGPNFIMTSNTPPQPRAGNVPTPGQSLKALGLENKLVPREKSLYLISHASLEKRGLSQGAANAYQMLHEPGNRMAFPFSLQSLQCTVDGRSIPLTAPSLKRGNITHNRSPGCTPLRTT